MPKREAVIPPFPGERQRALARRHYAVLGAALAVVAVVVAALAAQGWRRSLLDPGSRAVWRIEGAMARAQGADRLRAQTADAPGELAGLAVEAGRVNRRLQVRRPGGVVADEGESRGTIFWMPRPALGDLLAAGGPWRERFAVRTDTLGTGLDAPLRWASPPKGPAARVCEPAGFGPRLCWVREARERDGTLRGRALHDAATGLLLRLETYGPAGLHVLALESTTLPLKRARRASAAAFGLVLVAWCVWHVRAMRAAGLIDAVDPPGLGRLAVRWLAFPLLDLGVFSGVAMIYGAGALTWTADLVGFGLLLWAVGPYALVVLLKAVALVPGIPYPYFVPFHGLAVLAYVLVRYARRVTRSVLWPL